MTRLGRWLGEHRRPAGASWRKYLAFMRAAVWCEVVGHKAPVLLRKQMRRGRQRKLTHVRVCGRCGRPWAERSRTMAIPTERPRG